MRALQQEPDLTLQACAFGALHAMPLLLVTHTCAVLWLPCAALRLPVQYSPYHLTPPTSLGTDVCTPAPA